MRLLLDPGPASDGAGQTSTATPPPPAAPPAAPETPPAADPPAGTPTAAVRHRRPDPHDPLLAALFSDFEVPSVEEPVNPDPASAPVPAPAAPPPAPELAAAAPPPPDETPAPRKAKKSVIMVDDIPQPTPPPAAEPTPATPPAADPDESYVAGLTDEQRDELHEAEVAGRLFPEKYGDRRKKLLSWYRQVDSTAQQLRSADPERSLDENDDEFKRFLDTKPRMDAAASKRVQRSIGAEEAVKEVKSTYEPKLEELKRKQDEIEFKPQAEKIVSQIGSGVMNLIVNDEASPLTEAAKAMQQKGDSAADDYPLEVEIVQREMKILSTAANEMAHFSRGIRKYDANNPYHAGLVNFINVQGDAFKANGGNLRIRDGKSFITRAEMAQLRRAKSPEADRYWTFSDRDVFVIMANQAKKNMEDALKQEQELAGKRGFVRKAKANSAPTPNPIPEPQPLRPPVSPPAPSPGRPGGGTVVPPRNPNEIDVVETLGLLR